MFRSHPFRFIFVSLLSLMLAACGGSGDDGPNTVPMPDDEIQQTEPEPEPEPEPDPEPEPEPDPEPEPEPEPDPEAVRNELEAQARQLESELAEARTRLAETLDLLDVIETGHFAQPEERELARNTYQRVKREQEATVQTLEARLSDVYFQLEKLGVVPEPMEPEPEPEAWQGESEAFRYDSIEQSGEFAYGTPSYRIATLEQQDAATSRQAPVYYHSVKYLHIGPEVARPSSVDQLPVFGPVGDTKIRHGRIEDGIGRDALVDYLKAVTDGTILRPVTPPVIHLAEGTSPRHVNYAIWAIQMINSALPSDMRLQVSDETVPARSSTVPDGKVYIDFVPWREVAIVSGRQDAAGYTSYPVRSYDPANPDGFQTSAHIWIQDDYWNRFAPGGGGEANMLVLLAHELMHAVGLSHPNPQRTDTVLKPSIDDPSYHPEQPRDLLWPADREGLLAIHTALKTGNSPSDLGAWDSASWHISGEIPDVIFGVRARNGFAEPWAQGRRNPFVQGIEYNTELSGSASWAGHLVGFTPATESVVGGAALTVDLTTLNGSLNFADLEHWGAEMAPGELGTGMTWGDGDLSYMVNVRGNTFIQSGGDEGIVTGAFFGESHEAMGGVLERDDLTAAFGGKR